MRQFHGMQGARWLRPALQLVALAVAAVACLATSRPRRPTHEPVYMSWTEFRNAAQVRPPRAIHEHGKIYVFGKRLFVSEPNRGIHVIDNADPRAPKRVAFLRIPGNVDLAAKGAYLYADSFVDLLVFRLDPEPRKIELVRRLKDVFPYDYRQTLPANERIVTGRVDRKKGVVVGWKRIKKGGGK